MRVDRRRACSTRADRGPYGYEGLGELFVFLFFGLVAVTGSYYVQTEELTWEAFALAVPVGLLAVGDPGREQRARHRHRPPRRQAHAGRAARAASGRARCSRAMLVLAYVVPLAIPACRRPVVVGGPAAARRPRSRRRCGATVSTRTDGPSLNAALAGTGRLLAVFSLLLSAGILLS